jgi:hypothetical protein
LDSIVCNLFSLFYVKQRSSQPYTAYKNLIIKPNITRLKTKQNIPFSTERKNTVKLLALLRLNMSTVLTQRTETECLLGGRVSAYHSVCFKSINCLNIRITSVKFLDLSAGNFSEPWLTLRESAVRTVDVPK